MIVLCASRDKTNVAMCMAYVTAIAESMSGRTIRGEETCIPPDAITPAKVLLLVADLSKVGTPETMPAHAALALLLHVEYPCIDN